MPLHKLTFTLDDETYQKLLRYQTYLEKIHESVNEKGGYVLLPPTMEDTIQFAVRMALTEAEKHGDI